MRICSIWTELKTELICLKEILFENSYRKNVINKCFQKIIDNIHVVKKTTLKVEDEPLVLVLPYLGSKSLQTRTKLKKSFKNILNCCKLQIVFKNNTRLGHDFHLKNWFSQDLTTGVIYKFQCGLYNEYCYGEYVRQEIDEDIGISPLIKK